MSRHSKHYKDVKKHVKNVDSIKLMDKDDFNGKDVWNPEYEEKIDVVLIAPSTDSVGRTQFVEHTRQAVRELKSEEDGVIMKVIDSGLNKTDYDFLVELQFT